MIIDILIDEIHKAVKIFTWFFCPILWARAWACKSFWGFQSESKIITVSAVAKFIPKPPALVERRKQKSVDPSALKWSRACFLISPFILPSSLWNGKCLLCRYSASISNILTIWENISTLCPVSFSLHRSLSNSNSLPDPLKSFWNKWIITLNKSYRNICAT